tara:strand:+ start:3428 stop:4255 length:828 start_codon:yes stop_codon:yes gene_type:complete
MATIDLGRIKFKWQGAWSSSTAYVVDDVVESGGSTYICIAASTNNVPPNATYWELMADGGSPTTTQGDIIVRGASNDGRLAIGAAGQFLKVNSGATGLEYGDVSVGLTPSVFVNLNSDSGNTNSQTWYNIGGTAVGGTEIYDTDNAFSSGVFTVPSGKAGTYLINIFSSHTGSSSHSGSDGTLHRVQKSTDSGSSWSVTPTNGEYKSYYLNSPGAEMTAAFSTHIAYNISVGDQLRMQVWSYKGASTNVVWRAGDTNGAGAGSTAGTYFQLMKIF